MRRDLIVWSTAFGPSFLKCPGFDCAYEMPGGCGACKRCCAKPFWLGWWRSDFFAARVTVHLSAAMERMDKATRVGRGVLAAAVVLLFVVSPSPADADARGDARAQVAFGILVAQKGLWREAIYRFERAVDIDPTYAAAYNNLAIAYEQAGMVEKARAAYEKAIALEPKNEVIRENYDQFKEIHDRTNRSSE